MDYGGIIGARGAIDTDKEVLAAMYAAAYDEANGQFITPDNTYFKAASIDEVRRRFSDIRAIARRHTPELLDELNAIEGYAIQNLKGSLSDEELIVLLRKYVIRHGLNPHLIDGIEARINAREGVIIPFAPAMRYRQPQFAMAAMRTPKLPNFFNMPKMRPMPMNVPKGYILKEFGFKPPKVRGGLKPFTIAPPQLRGGMKFNAPNIFKAPTIKAPDITPRKGGLRPIRFNAPRVNAPRLGVKRYV